MSARYKNHPIIFWRIPVRNNLLFRHKDYLRRLTGLYMRAAVAFNRLINFILETGNSYQLIFIVNKRKDSY